MTKNLQDYLLVEWTYHSNSIEGNTLSKTETKIILEDGITIGGKTVREHLEAINHKEAILFLEDLVKNEQDITQRVIRELHGTILRGIDAKNAGIYRKQNVLISGATHIPPDATKVTELMEGLVQWYHDNETVLHPVIRSSILHSEFVKIHLFIDVTVVLHDYS